MRKTDRTAAGERKEQNDFTRGDMRKVIIRMALPMMLAQAVNVLYSIVDRIYIGHIPGVGSLALTGLGLTMPIVSIITAFASLCGTGGGPLCSIARGKGDLAYAEKVMGNAFGLLLVLAAALTVGFLAFMEPILRIFGASEDTYFYAAEYAQIYILGTVFVMISSGMNYFINAQGFARTGMLTVLLGAVVNIVLDPVFIFVLDMGIRGAAAATVIAQACSAAWALAFLLSDRAILDLRLKNLRPEGRVLGRILGLGVTGFVMSATTGLVQIAGNVQLSAYGGDLYVGAMTVVNSIREVTFVLVHGLTAGAQPVLGYNYGAEAWSRVRGGIRFISQAAVAYAFAVWLLIMLLPGPLTRIFNSDPALVEACVPALRIYFCGFMFMSLQTAGQSVFVALGKSRHAICFSLLRKVVIVLPLIFLLPMTGLGVSGVFWSEPISDLLGGVACYVTMYLTQYRKLAQLKETGGTN